MSRAPNFARSSVVKPALQREELRHAHVARHVVHAQRSHRRIDGEGVDALQVAEGGGRRGARARDEPELDAEAPAQPRDDAAREGLVLGCRADARARGIADDQEPQQRPFARHAFAWPRGFRQHRRLPPHAPALDEEQRAQRPLGERELHPYRISAMSRSMSRAPCST